MSTVFDNAMLRINEAFAKLYESDPHIISVFVVGSMAMRPYTERKYNDYDIRCIVDTFVPETFDRVNQTVNQCVEAFRDDPEIGVASSDLVGPVNHHVTNREHNVLIHCMVHSVADLTGFLPDTHKYMYGNHYLHVCGRDILAELKLSEARYTLQDIVEGYEGIDYCMEMIQKRTHRYCRYEVIDNACVFVPYELPSDPYIRHENCFYSTLKNIGNLRHHDFFTGLAVEDSLFAYGKRILSEVGFTDDTLLDILLKKEEERLDSLYPAFEEATLALLRALRGYVVGRMEAAQAV